MPSGPFILCRTISTLAGNITTLRIWVCLPLILGWRYWPWIGPATTNTNNARKVNLRFIASTSDLSRLLKISFLYRGRERRLASLPLPPNRTGSFPASGSPVDGSPRRGLTQLRLGLCKREQPLRGKESIGPALMIAPPAPSTPFLSFAQSTAQ